MNLIESKRSDIYNTKALYDEILKISNHLFAKMQPPFYFTIKMAFVLQLTANRYRYQIVLI
jgi:hypothetical protein